jgi:Leucine Rich repeat
LTHLNMNGNNFMTPPRFTRQQLLKAQKYYNYELPTQNPALDQLSIFLWSNKRLEHLEISGCQMDDQCAEAVAEGLSRNTHLRYLDLSNNRIGKETMKRWQEVIAKSSLRYLDFSNNPLYDEGA